MKSKVLNPEVDALVQWTDGTKNVVRAVDLTFKGKLRKGCKVIMKWKGQNWHGVVLDVDQSSSDDNAGDNSDSDQDIPLAQLRNSKNTTTGSTVSTSQEPRKCEDFFCNEEVWSCCHNCFAFLCYDHFLLNNGKTCHTHNVFFSAETNNVASSLLVVASSGPNPIGTGNRQVSIASSLASCIGLTTSSLSTSTHSAIASSLHVLSGSPELPPSDPVTSPSVFQDSADRSLLVPCSGTTLTSLGTSTHVAIASSLPVLPASLELPPSDPVTSPSVFQDSADRSLLVSSSQEPNFLSTISTQDTGVYTLSQLPGTNTQVTFMSFSEPGCSSLHGTAPVMASSIVADASPPILSISCMNGSDVEDTRANEGSILSSLRGISCIPGTSAAFSDESSVPSCRSPQSSLIDAIYVVGEECATAENSVSVPVLASLPTASAKLIPDDTLSQPEDFPVDGEPRPLSPPLQHLPKSKNALVKYHRNRGEAYNTEKSNKEIPSKRAKIDRSNCWFCTKRGLDCLNISTEERQHIKDAYYNMADLKKQREWILRYVSVNPVDEESNQYIYYLPKPGDKTGKYHVCRKKFMTTIGVSFSQVRTALRMVDEFGVLADEGRGGRKQIHRDELIRQQVLDHINRFPRMESHYCRANSKCQYLSPDLNLTIMYKMYIKEDPNGASLSLYKKVFHSLNLKFHHPKKDLCGLCDTFIRAGDEKKKALQEKYDGHVREKNKSRELKAASKRKAATDNNICAAVFDLQQVIYLPKSDRSELFYKRRLSCFNFTIYDLGTKDGFCFVSHEGMTARGSSEIASHLHKFLLNVDERGCKQVELYSDGCCGQNKNSIIPAMFMYFVERSNSVQEVSLHFFETNHGQSEGDAIHSSIERQMRQMGELTVPSQLEMLIKMARRVPRPYIVTSVQSSDILDWKSYSQGRGILRVRSTEKGTNVDWTKFMQVRVCKHEANTILFKYSHADADFEVLKIGETRRHSGHVQVMDPEPLYPQGYHNISEAKYQDLKSLCTGPYPVVNHPDYQAFYRSLHH